MLSIESAPATIPATRAAHFNPASALGRWHGLSFIGQRIQGSVRGQAHHWHRSANEYQACQIQSEINGLPPHHTPDERGGGSFVPRV